MRPFLAPEEYTYLKENEVMPMQDFSKIIENELRRESSNILLDNVYAVESTFTYINTAFKVIGGRKWKKELCGCDEEIGFVPCEYCAMFKALTSAERLISENVDVISKSKAVLEDIRINRTEDYSNDVLSFHIDAVFNIKGTKHHFGKNFCIYKNEIRDNNYNWVKYIVRECVDEFKRYGFNIQSREYNEYRTSYVNTLL